MAEVDKSKDYSKWESIIKASVKFRNKSITDEEFKTYTNYYKGRFNKEKKKTDRVEVNMVYSTTSLLMSALANKDPWIAFKARKKEYKSREMVCEEAVNNTLSDIGFKDTLQLNIRDSQLCGYGVGKCGYSVDGKVEEKKKEKGKKDQSERPEYDVYIADDSVYFNLIDPKKLLLDPTSSKGIDDSRQVIEVLTQNKDFIAKKYGIEADKISAGIPAFIKDKYEDMDKETQKVFDIVVFYEIWDIIKEKRIIMIEGYTDKVFEYEWPKHLKWKNGKCFYPYELLVFNDAPNEPYGISDVSLYRTQQEELNVVRSMEAEIVKKNNPKWQAEASGVELKEIKKFMGNETGTVIGVSKSNAISRIETHQMSTDFGMYESRITNDIKEVMGVSDVMRGGGGGRKTATQSYSEDFFARLRIGMRQNKVDKFVLNVAMKLFNIMQIEYEAPKYIELVGDDGKYIASTYTKDNIEGEYDPMVQQGTGAQNKSYMAQTVETGIKYLTGNPLISPKEWTDIIIDVFLDGLDTSKLMIPNAEEILKDPIAKEQFRQTMLTVQSQSMLQQATQAIMQQGQPQGAPGATPEQGAPQQPPGAGQPADMPHGRPPVGGLPGVGGQ